MMSLDDALAMAEAKVREVFDHHLLTLGTDILAGRIAVNDPDATVDAIVAAAVVMREQAVVEVRALVRREFAHAVATGRGH